MFEDVLPMLVEMKEINGILTPTISMKNVNNLDLNQEEQNEFIKVILYNGISVIDDEFEIDCDEINYNENYKSYRFDKKTNLPILLKNREINEKFIKLRITNDNKIREELILGTMHLVTYYSWFYSKVFMIELEDAEQYGYEALIHAVDNYDLEKDFYIYAKVYMLKYV